MCTSYGVEIVRTTERRESIKYKKFETPNTNNK